MRELLVRGVDLRLPGLFGLCLFTVALFRYESFETREILGRWSVPYTVVLAAACGLLGFMAVRCWLRARQAESRASTPARLFDLALFAWGLAYLLSALEAREAGARVLEGNLFGSVAPAPSILEWAAIVLALAAGTAFGFARAPAGGRKALLSVGSLLLLLCLVEGALRLRAVVAPQTQGFPTYTAKAWGRRYVMLNSEGFRDSEHPRSAPAGTQRLLLVGDSYGFGTGIERLEDRFGEQLAFALTETTGTPWQSISAAHPDSHTRDELGFLERMLAYDPDLVVLLYVFNDMDYLTPTTRRAAVTGHPTAVLDRLRPTRLLFSNSYAFQELYVRLRLAWFALAEPSQEDSYANEEIVSTHLEDLRRFASLARGSGAAVVIVPFELTVLIGDHHLARYREFLARLDGASLPAVDLARAFDGHAYAELTVNRLDRHPNPLANRLAALATSRQVNRYLPAD